MQASFVTIDAYRFSLNGLTSFKIFQVLISGDLVKVFNVYDSRFVLVPSLHYSEFEIDGATYGSALALANALAPVLYTRQTNGAAGSYNGVSADPGNQLTNGIDGAPFLDPGLFPTSAEVLSGDAATLEAAKDYANTLGGGGLTEPNKITKFTEGYDTGLNYVPYIEWTFDEVNYKVSTPITLDPTDTIPAGETRIDILIATSAGTIIKRTGIPAVNPVKPSVDPLTELEATFIILAANAAAPENVNLLAVYRENGQTGGGEFDVFENTSGARINQASLSQKYAGSVSIEASSLNKNDIISFTPGAPLVKNDYSRLKYRLKNKAGNYGSAALVVTLYGLDALGDERFISLDLPRNYGWDFTNLTDWQLISLPIPTLDRIISLTSIQFRNSAQSNENLSFFLDEVYLVSGTGNGEAGSFVTSAEVTSGDAATLAAAKAYAEAQDVITLQAAKDYTDGIAGADAGASVKKRYLTWAALLADQLAHIDKGIYYAEDASGFTTVDAGYAYFEYLGTVLGTEEDYRKLSEEESMDVAAVSIEPAQVTKTVTTSFNSEALTDLGYSQNEKNVIIENSTNAITITAGVTENFLASYQKEGTGIITFAASAGKTLRQVDGTNLLDGEPGSTATVSVIGNIVSLRISNA